MTTGASGSGPKILTVDIETSAMKSWHFDTFRVNINPIQIIEPSRIVCFAAKWRDKQHIMFADERAQDDPRGGHDDMIAALVRLLDEADVVVTYNGNGFDLPWIEWERKLLNLPKPSPFISVDLYSVVKKNFKEAPARRSLDYITSRLELTGKLHHAGYFPLWIDMNGDDPDKARKAWAIFRRYNKRDVLTTEELLDVLEDDVTNLPHLGLYGPEKAVSEAPGCPRCLSEHVTRQGYKRTKTRRYPQFQCQSCGKWFSLNRSDMGVDGS